MIKYLLFRFIWLFGAWFFILSLVFFMLEYALWDYYPSPLTFWQFLEGAAKDYWVFLTDIVVEWEWGEDNIEGVPNMELFQETAPFTMRIVGFTMVFSIIMGIAIGLFLARIAGSKADSVIQTFMMIFAAVPNYIWLFIFIIIFGFLRPVLPWYWPFESEPSHVRFAGYIIPVSALSFVPITRFAILIRGETIESFQNGYVDLLRAKGMSRSQILFRHLIRDSLYPILPVFATTFIFVLTSSFLIEQIYKIPGVSILLFRSLFKPFMDMYYFRVDIQITTLVSWFYLGLALLSVIFADIILMIIDPRVRMHKNA